MSRVTILGCGPAGLAAAAAVVSSGHRATILSNTDKPSTLHGCQYLHAPIPGYEDVSHTVVSYDLIGTPEQYRRKVYGELWHGQVSPEDFIGEHHAWDIRETYRLMWARLIDGRQAAFQVMPPVTNGRMPDEVYETRPDKIISTIPAPALCYRQHEFRAHMIFANGTTEALVYPEDSIICDGTDGNDWYRISRVFGYQTTEWAHTIATPPGSKAAVKVVKPLVGYCDCYPEIGRLGRYGAWRKSYLVHQVYPDAQELFRLWSLEAYSSTRPTSSWPIRSAPEPTSLSSRSTSTER